MPSQVTMLCLQELDSNDLNLLKIITFLGLKSQVIFLDDSAYALNRLQEQPAADDACAVINCKALSRVHVSGGIEELKEFFISRNASVLVYNISPNDAAARTISSLSGGKLRSVYPLSRSAQNYTISNENIYITRHFHGLSFGPIHREHDFTFNAIYDHEDMISLITIDDHPFFVKCKKCRCDVFYVANNQIVDIDMKLENPKRIRDYFSQLVPEVMFLKYVFGDTCWHTEKVYANLIIDDPLLKRKYGFLNYRTLLEVMDRHNIRATIAFIPINYKKTDQDTARLFLERPDRLSLCVHGSQHTHNEFAINDLSELNHKITLATQRMDEHERTTGVPYQKVMIFPRGIFSHNSMKMLKYNTYCAAVNTEAIAWENNIQLKLSDCMEPIVMRYSQFPLFLRRYPASIEDFAFDLFFGKSLLIVEHHTYFKHGYQNLEDFIREIRTLDSSIRWENLEAIVKQTCLIRSRPDGNIDVKMYANPLHIVNDSENKQTYYIKKTEPEPASIQAINIVGGEIMSCEKNADHIAVIAEIGPGTRAELTIEYADHYSSNIYRHRTIDSMNVLLRRYLSEIRDNYISKSDLLSFVLHTGLKGVTWTRDLMNNPKQLND